MKVYAQKGLTLIEILTVISIISLLFILLLPFVGNIFIKANEAGVRTNFNDFQVATQSLLRDGSGKGINKDNLNRYLDIAHEVKAVDSSFVTSSVDSWKNPYFVEFGDRKITFYSNGKTEEKTERAYQLISYYYEGVVSSCTIGFPENLNADLPGVGDTFNCGDELPNSSTTPPFMPSDPLLKPTDFRTNQITERSINVSWKKADGATQYILKRNGTIIYRGSNTTYTDTGLNANTTYTYEVASRNTRSVSEYVTLSATTTIGPATPANFVAQNIMSSSVNLSWQASTYATSYVLYKDNVIIYQGSARSYKNTGLNPYTTYTYKLVSVNANGESPPVGLTIKTAPSEETVKLPDQGTGSCNPYNPYIITTVGELQGMQLDLRACYKLGKNINATPTKHWNAGKGFVPIGSTATFRTLQPGIPGDVVPDNFGLWGEFDGDGYTISNLYINRANEQGVGLFVGVTNIVENVKLTNVYVEGYKDVGGLVGGTIGSSIIRNVEVTGVVNGYFCVGGVVGFSKGLVEDTIASAELYSITGHVGGVVGETKSPSVIQRTTFNGSIRGSQMLGGVVGFVNTGTILHSTSNATFILTDVGAKSTIGGIVGHNIGYVADIVSNAIIVGEANHVGGIVGVNDPGGRIERITNNSQVNVIGVNVGPIFGVNSGIIR